MSANSASPRFHVGDALVIDFRQEESQLMTMSAMDILRSDRPALPPFLQRFTNTIEGCDRTARRGKLANTFRDPEQIDILKRDFHRAKPPAYFVQVPRCVFSPRA